MSGCIQHFRRFLSIVSLLLAAVLTAHAGEPATAPAEMLADAELHDILFLDPDRGWAVGDRGVIWQTEDGGRRWQLTDSPTTARLRSIHFIDAEHGWIAGGWTHPYTHRTSAVLLKTENGGKKWTRVDVPTMPALKRIHFDSARRGWALGDSSAMYSAGLFFTADGGYTWQEPPNSEQLSFLAGDFQSLNRDSAFDRPRAYPATTAGSEQAALLIAADRSTWLFSSSQFQLSTQKAPRPPRAVRLAPTRGWLVGERGMVLESLDGGNRWQAPKGRLPDDVGTDFDWQAISTSGNHCWIAGVPGSAVLHTGDEGRTWKLFRTQQSLPINRLHFIDDQHGWAVCPLGRILATRDGGQTWRIQQSGAERTALLAIHAFSHDIPLEVLAKAAAEEGRISGAIVLFPKKPAPSETSTTVESLREACSSIGVSVAESLSLAQLPEANGDDLQRQLVRSLRIWRPEVVITDNISGKENDHDRRLSRSAQAVLQAVQLAADPAAYPDQVVLAGLQPWRVQKVFGVLNSQDLAGPGIDTGRLSMPLGCSLSDYTVEARGLVTEQWQPPPRSSGYRLLWSQSTQDSQSRDLFSGIPPSNLGESRRAVSLPATTRLEQLSKSAQSVRNLQEIAARGIGGNGNMATILPQIEQLMQGQESLFAGRLLHRLAQQFIEGGQYSAAAECLAISAARFPEHVLNDAALMWLIRYHTSAEIQHAFGRNHVLRLPNTRTVAAVAPIPTDLIQGQNQSVQQADFKAQLEQTVPSDDLTGLRLAEEVRQTRPALFADPRIQFPVVSLNRRLRKNQDVSRMINILAGGQLAGSWRTVAVAEQRLLDRQNRPIANRTFAARSAEKPLLDGNLDEPMWKTAETIQCDVNNPERRTELKIAHDDEYLYIAVQCSKGRRKAIRPSSDARERDALSLDGDHVELALDVDRDYQTAYRLCVDERGWTRDACDSDLRFNPQWFVAANNNELEWTVEAAIPTAELTPVSPLQGNTWCLRVDRYTPGAITVSWPNGTTNESFGLVSFAESPKIDF